MSVRLAAVWRDYRNRRRALFAALVAAPILATAGAPAAGASSLQHLLAASWATALVATLVWFAAFRCPHCARPFHWTWIVANPLSRECLHCGFAKWRDPLAARQYAPRADGR